MTPMLRVIISAPNFATQVAGVDGGLDPNVQIVIAGASALSYMTYMTTNLVPPAGAVYADKIDENGNVTVVVAKQAGYNPKIPYTFFGWPVPA